MAGMMLLAGSPVGSGRASCVPSDGHSDHSLRDIREKDTEDSEKASALASPADLENVIWGGLIDTWLSRITITIQPQPKGGA